MIMSSPSACRQFADKVNRQCALNVFHKAKMTECEKVRKTKEKHQESEDSWCEIWLRRRDLNPRPPGYEYLGNFAKVPSLAWAFVIFGAILPTTCRQSSKNAPFSTAFLPPKCRRQVPCISPPWGNVIVNYFAAVS